MSNKQIPESLSSHMTQVQYDRLCEYFRTAHTKIDITPKERDDIMNGRGWPEPCVPDPLRAAKEMFASLNDAQRAEVAGEYCNHCWRPDPTCRCWDDE